MAAVGLRYASPLRHATVMNPKGTSMKMLFCTALLILFCAGNGVAESPRQIRSPESIEAKHVSELKQYGTEQFPLVVKTIQPPKSKEETESDADERNDRKALRQVYVFRFG